MSKRVLLIIMLVVGLLAALVVPTSAQGNRPGRPDDRPFLGVQYEDVDGEAVVTRVLPNTPADEAGVMVGDVIVAVNDEAVDSSNVADTIGGLMIDELATLTIRRDGETLDLEVTLASRGFRLEERANFVDGAFLGINLESVDDGQLVVKEVVADGPAANGGIQVDDVLTAIDGETISEIGDVVAVLSAKAPGDTVSVTVERDGESLDLEIELGSRFAPGMNFDMQIPLGGDEVEYNADDSTWTLVTVNENGVLAEAGLQDGDVITAVDGEALSPDTVPNMRGFMAPDGTITLTVQRDGETLEIDAPSMVAIALIASQHDMMAFQGMLPGMMQPFGFRGPDGNMPFDFHFRGPDGMHDGMRPFGFGNPNQERFGQRGFGFQGMDRAFLGVAFATLDEDVAADNGLDVTEGALIQDVLKDSPADTAGLMVGDVIVAVDGDLVDEERTLADRIHAYEAGDTIMLDVMRDGDTIQVDVTLGEPMGMMMPNVPPRVEEKPDA